MKLSLAEQIAQLSETAPVDFDPEDVHLTTSGPLDVESSLPGDNTTAAREHYLEVGPSAIRKLHDSISDPKYGGVRTSRSALLDEEDVTSEVEDDATDLEESTPGLSGPDDESTEEEGLEEEDVGSDDEEEDEEVASDDGHDDAPDQDVPPITQATKPTLSSRTPPPPPPPPPAPSDPLSHTLRQKREEDIKKGKAISRQLALWDSVLDARIRLQKAVAATNRLPVPGELSAYRSDPACAEALERLSREALDLSEELFGLREDLLTANESITPPPRKRRRLSSSDDEEPETALREASVAAAALDHAFHPHLVYTLAKWSAKIQAVTPSALLPSARNAFNKSTAATNAKPAPQLIDDALAPGAPLSKALSRTRVWRGKGGRLGVDGERELGQGAAGNDEKDGEMEDPELFDDTDFYQQLLRDVIDARSGGGSAGDANADWHAAQRQKKARKKVDTKASKGRKLRYEVHEKLVNFMVPVPVPGAWHEEQIDELFAGLLGRGYEKPEEQDQEEHDQERVVVEEGFRVFG